MQARRALSYGLAAFVVFGSLSSHPLAPHAHAQAQQQLPPLQYTCPMHPEVLESKTGSCPICKMPLEPTRIDDNLNYSCPNHPVVITQKPGACPIDRRELVPVVVTLHWTCRQSPDQKLMEPGKCADGSSRQLVKQIRAHGDHNPRHGGGFFMAQDQWHHVEGTYPREGLFRAYFYDNYTQPMEPKGFTGRVVTREEFDYTTKTAKELESFPLTLSRDGKTLDATLKNVKAPSKDAPVTMTMKVRLTKDAPEQSFTFSFVEFSKDPPVAPAATTAKATTGKPAPTTAPASTTTAPGATAGKPTPAAAAAVAVDKPTTAPAAPAAAPAPSPATVVQSTPAITNCEPNMARSDALLLSDSLPKSSSALLTLLDMCSAEVQKLVQGAQFGFIYQPTMLGKDIALALENYVNSLPASRRPQAADAIRRTVLAAWQLDMFGDMGNQEKISEAYTHFAAAIAAVKTAYAAQP
jgi:hypothetical protein